jgi:hypothetical protein
MIRSAREPTGGSERVSWNSSTKRGQGMNAAEFSDRLDRIESLLQLLIEQRTIKEWYSTAEVAKLLGKAEFTVREWCRLGRIRARKKECGRGIAGEWIISHEELTRVRNESLLPELNPYRHVK